MDETDWPIPLNTHTRRSIASFARSIYQLHFSNTQTGYDPDTSEALRCFLLAPPFFLSRALVYKKARLGCGLDRCPLLYTGAAPLNPTT